MEEPNIDLQGVQTELKALKQEVQSLRGARTCNCNCSNHNSSSSTAPFDLELQLDQVKDDLKRLSQTYQQLQTQQQQQQQLSSQPQTLPQSPQSTGRRRSSLLLMDQEQTLNPDSFSLLAVAKTFSLPWNSSVLILAIQLFSFSLVLLDILAQGKPGNVFGVPGGASAQLRGIQMIALVIAVATQDDLVKGVCLLRPGLYQHMEPHFHYLKAWKFWLAVVSQCVEGCIGILASFLLIITQTTVMDLLLNFTALGFVSQLDELVFFLSRMGILGRRFKRAVGIVHYTSFPAYNTHSGWRKALVLVGIMVVLFVWWLLIAFRQSNGFYLCPSGTLLVQFGDDYIPALGTFSGLYVMKNPSIRFFQAARVEYVMEQQSSSSLAEDDDSFVGRLAYCSDFQAWTFLVGNDSDPCQDWVARSSETASFDITETLDLPWYARGGINGRVVALTPFLLSCYNCEDDLGCSGHGTCESYLCGCEEDWHGLRCEFRAPCESLFIDARTDPFLGAKLFPKDYQLLRSPDQPGPGARGDIVEIYHRPIYIHEEAKGPVDIIFYTGRRWALVSQLSLSLSNITRFYRYGMQVAFLSEPTDIGTLTDAFSPVGLKWFAASAFERLGANEKQGVDLEQTTRLICSVCDNEFNPCLFDGVCVGDGTCNCTIGSNGNLCEVTPVGNGRCDCFYNHKEFEFDGGDCCESTCKSTAQFICGTEDKGYTNIGYHFCAFAEDDKRWYANGESVDVYPNSILGLARNGQVLVAGSTDTNSAVKIYDKQGPIWTQRASLPDIGLFNLAVGSGKHNAYNNPDFVAPLTVVASHSPAQTGGNGLLVYECSSASFGCVSLDVPPQNSTKSALFEDIAISSDSSVIAAVSSDNDIMIYENKFGRLKLRDSLSPPSQFKVVSVSLSANGDVLAVMVCALLGGPQAGCETIQVELYKWHGTTYHFDTVLQAKNDLAWDIDYLRFELKYTTQWMSFGLEISEDGSVVSTWAINCAMGVAEIAVFEVDRWRLRGISLFDDSTDEPTCEEELCDGENDCVDNIEKYGKVSLSADGSVLAFRIGGAKAAHVLEWKGEKYSPVGQALPSSPSGGLAFAMSPEGLISAVSNPGREVTVYSFSRPCQDGTSLLRLSLTLDTKPEETSWRIFDYDTKEVILEGEGYSGAYAKGTVVEEACVPTDRCLIFTIFDAGRNGLYSPGLYALFMNGVDVGRGSFEGTYKSVVIGSCQVCTEGRKMDHIVGNCTLCECQDPFIGRFPTELGFLSTLQKLHLDPAKPGSMYGTIPSQIGLMTGLTSVDFSSGNLSGVLPSELGKLTALTSMIIDDSGELLGTVPSEIFKLTALRFLDIDENQLSGSIGSEFGLLTLLEALELYSLQLSGPLSSELGLLTSLTSLEVHDNPLTGTIPLELAESLTNLVLVRLDNTNISGTIPSQFCDIATLQFNCSESLCGCHCACAPGVGNWG